MKVVKAAPTWCNQHITCATCRCEMEIEFSDLKRVHHDAGPDQRDPAWDDVFITCPECSSKISVNGVPAHLVVRIPLA